MHPQTNEQHNQPTPPSPPASRNELQKYLQAIWTRLDELGQRMTTLEQKTASLLAEARALTGEGSETQPSLKMLMHGLQELSERLDRVETTIKRQQ